MEPVPNPPKLQILVCTNQRAAHDPLPCCANSGEADAVFQRLHGYVLERGWASTVYVTRTHCMGWCNTQGATLVLQPLGVWLRRVTREDAERIIHEILEPMMVEGNASTVHHG